MRVKLGIKIYKKETNKMKYDNLTPAELQAELDNYSEADHREWEASLSEPKVLETPKVKLKVLHRPCEVEKENLHIAQTCELALKWGAKYDGVSYEEYNQLAEGAK